MAGSSLIDDNSQKLLKGHITSLQPLNQRSKGELHTTALSAAEGPDGRVDDDEVERRHRHEEGSASDSGSQNRRR